MFNLTTVNINVTIKLEGGKPMDVNTVVQIINGVGFPIAACIGMAAYFVWDKKTRREERKEQQDETFEMINKLSDAVAANTLVIQKLIDKLNDNAN